MGKNQDPGSGINILDPQHCRRQTAMQFSWLALYLFKVNKVKKYQGRVWFIGKQSDMF
jgi:hypothetical protein